MPVIQHNEKWFRISIQEVWSYRQDERQMGFAAAGVSPPERPKEMLRVRGAFKGTWEEIGVPGVHLVDVGFDRDWQPIYDAIVKAEQG